MEWVETTGRTIEDALDAALDQLGVHEEDAEYEVLQEPKKGLLGIGASDARLRVRIRPVSREKPADRRRGKGRKRPDGGSRRGRREGDEGRSEGGGGASRGAGTGSGRGSGRGGRGNGGRSGGANGDGDRGAARPAKGSDRDQERAPRPAREDSVDEDSMPVEEQSRVAAAFVTQLAAAMEMDATVSPTVDDDVILVDVAGENLGLLVGPKGATIQAIEELTRAVVQHESGGHGARVRLDIAGYRAKRREALESFARKLAQQVIDSGEELDLEPMSAPDRKVVHDTVAEIDGVETASEGEDPRRYVVIRPA